MHLNEYSIYYHCIYQAHSQTSEVAVWLACTWYLEYYQESCWIPVSRKKVLAIVLWRYWWNSLQCSPGAKAFLFPPKDFAKFFSCICSQFSGHLRFLSIKLSSKLQPINCSWCCIHEPWCYDESILFVILHHENIRWVESVNLEKNPQAMPKCLTTSHPCQAHFMEKLLPFLRTGQYYQETRLRQHDLE